jgi:eukaryotic-like serine/threonine-protein kinase
MSARADPNDTVAMTPWGGASATPGTDDPVLLAARYEILGLLGSGGMGNVYRARDRELDEIIALKTLREGTIATPRLLERFRREVKLARRVTHPNVARTFDIGEHGSEKFLTMEYVDGEALSALLAREGPLLGAQAAALGREICAGLEAAHAAGVVHRDLKPENVLLEKGGRVVITDFGIACAHEDPSGIAKTLGGSVGTPAYMSPEQVEGAADVDARADLYALGVMLFEMLTGQMPWRGESPYAVASARLYAPPPDPRRLEPTISEAMAGLVMHCMAQRRQERPASAALIARELERHAPTLDLGAPPSSRAWRPPEPAGDTERGDKTVAVLPLRNGGPAEDEYVADGLTEDLIDTLSMTPGLKVRPYASVLGQREGDPRESGRRLGVQVVVDGSVRRVGESLRIAARLISVADGFQLWAKRFDRPRADALVVSDEAAQAIAEALTVEARGPERAAPSDASAVDLYLKAKSELRKIWRAPTKRAVDLLAEAHQRAPNDPMLLSAYALSRARLWYYDGGLEEGRAVRDLTDRALAKAPDRGESWLAVASARVVEQDLVAAVRLLKQALIRAPQLAEAHELLGEVLMEIGDLDASAARFRSALALDPAVRCRYHLSRLAALRGNWDEAFAVADVGSDDEHARTLRAASRARVALWSPNPEAALRSIEIPSDVEDPLPLGYALMVKSLIEARRVLPEQREFIQGHFVKADQAPRFVILKRELAAEAFAFTGDDESALAQLDAALGAGLSDVSWLRLCPLFRRLRERPEMAELIRVAEERAERVRAALAE